MVVKEKLEALGGGNAGTFELFSNESVFFPSLELLQSIACGIELNEEDKLIYKEIVNSIEQSKQLTFDWSVQEANYLKNNPEDTWLKYIIYRFKFSEYPKRLIESEFPVYLKIEPVSSCNLRCVMCFQVDKSFTRKPYMGTMTFDLFKRVIDEAQRGGTEAITLGSRGEPTLHPRLPEMLNYMSNKFIETKLITNATRLTAELAHKILQSDIDMLVYSVDADEKNLYERIRVKGNFDQVYENICGFNEIRRIHYPNSKITTRVSGVKFDAEQDIERFIKFWTPHIDEVGMKDAAIRWNTYENELNSGKESPCFDLWQNMYIWFDGIANPCDADYKSLLSPGSLKTHSIKEIWTGEKMKDLRKEHRNNKRNNITPCDRCGVHVAQ